VEVLQHNLIGGGPPDEDPLPDDGVDPHPLPDALVPPAAPFLPAPVEDNEEDAGEDDGWGHWAMGNNPQQEDVNHMEVDLVPNAAFQGLLDAIQAEEMNLDNPPLADSSSDITYSSGSSNSSLGAVNQQLVVHAGAPVGLIPFHQMGEGLQNIALAYIEEEEADFDDENGNGMIQQANAENIPDDNNENNFQLLEDVNMVPP
jgi:hypothetical protein